MVRICLSQALEVEELKFQRTIEGKHLHHLGKSRGRYSGIAASRSLRVMKSFQVSPCVLLAESSILTGENEEA